MNQKLNFGIYVTVILAAMQALAVEPESIEAKRAEDAADMACCGGDLVTALRTRVRVAGGERLLRISADPNNLPFTNDKLAGFENRIAALIARELGADLEYVWRAQRRGFFRQSLKEGECDFVLG